MIKLISELDSFCALAEGTKQGGTWVKPQFIQDISSEQNNGTAINNTKDKNKTNIIIKDLFHPLLE